MSDNEKALIAAAGAGNVEEIRRLKNLGTNLDAADANDWTALQTGAFNGKKESVKVLVELGASVNKASSARGEWGDRIAALEAPAPRTLCSHSAACRHMRCCHQLRE